MPTAPYTVESHIQLRRVSAIAPSPDGSWLAVAVQRQDLDGTKYLSDLWKLPADGGAAVQLTRGETRDAAPCFRHDGALGFLSNRQPNEIKPDEDADKRMQVWLLPAAGGEPQQLTDEPLGVEAFRFAARANRMILFTPVLTDVPHDKQRETAAERAKKGSSARNYRRQPVRHWDHWLHQNHHRANTHLVACKSDGTARLDLTPQATTELAIEPHLDISADGMRALVELIPNIDDLLSLEAEELGSRLILLMVQQARTVGNTKPHMGNMMGQICNAQLEPHLTYPREKWDKFQVAFAEAWNWLEVQGLLVPEPGSKHYTAFVKSELDRWTKVIKTAGIKIE